MLAAGPLVARFAAAADADADADAAARPVQTGAVRSLAHRSTATVDGVPGIDGR